MHAFKYWRIGKAKVTFEKLVSLLRMKIGNKLPFENYISFLCCKATNHLNAIN